MILDDIKRICHFAASSESKFLSVVMLNGEKAKKAEMLKSQKEFDMARKRIEEIVVHEADKSTGTGARTQKVDIYYNFVGAIPTLE